MNTRQVYYFGCKSAQESGHYFWRVPWRDATVWPSWLPESLHSLDGALAPRGHERQGEATLTHVDGWTVLAFWDRSADRRGKSNSAFIIEGDVGFEEAVALARERWPNVWARFTFPVVPVPLEAPDA